MLRLLLISVLFPAIIFAQSYQRYDTIADPDAALQQLFPALRNDASNAELLYLVAKRKMQKEEYDSSIQYANKCIGLLTRAKNNSIYIRVLYLKGRAQYLMDDKSKADENWRQSLQLALAEKDFEGITSASTGLGAIYLDQGYNKHNEANFHVADSFFAIAQHEILSRDSLMSFAGVRNMRLMATSLHFQKKYDSANHYYRKVIELARGKYPSPYLGALSFYAKSLSETGDHAAAIAAIKEAVVYTTNNSVNSKDRTHIMHVYAEVLSESGNYKNAYALIDSAYKLLAADYEKVNAQAYSESESKFKNQILQYQVQLERQKKNKLYYLTGGILLLAALTFLWLQNRNSKRIAREKARQKQISIDAFIEGEEKEKVRIGRELHDGIAQEIVAIKLAMLQQKADPKLIDELTQISLDIRNISHELMPQTLKEYGLKMAVEDICQKILAPSGIQFEVHSSLPEERMSDKIEITLYRVFQELVHNIIKHSQATEVLVQLRRLNNHILLVVEDNGKGMTTEKRNGIGISNLKSRVQLVDGNLQYDSSENEGTTAIVRVPV
ncbi:MAG: sensor histidine kinase [Bacteroidetes bacterium]|nr:sensor histidine kinase [Bacteroidota bacterium]